MKTKEILFVTTLEDLSTVIHQAIRLQPTKKETTERKRLTRKEAADFVGVNYHTFSKWVRQGRIPAHGFGKIRFFYKDELLEIMTQKNA